MASSQDPQVCVFCRHQPVDPQWRPFCSERCKMQDLARWATGSYRAPAEAVPDEKDQQDSQDAQEVKSDHG
jgi:endogenous inhibitor of DNA gyrase (YacG/DUF329 family)